MPRPQFWIYIYLLASFVKAKINDKRDDFDFDIVNLSFLDGDVPLWCLYLSTYSICSSF